LQQIAAIGVFTRSRAATLIFHARYRWDRLKELLTSTAVLKLVPLSVVVFALRNHVAVVDVHGLLSIIAGRVLHRVKAPQRLIDVAFIQAIRLDKPDVGLKWLHRGANLHVDNNIAFLLALVSGISHGLSALSHWRERPHAKVVSTDTGSVTVQCNCAMMTGARYLVELWLRDRSLSQHSDFSRHLISYFQGRIDSTHCMSSSCGASHGILVFPPNLPAAPQDHLRLKQFVAKCLSQRMWRSLELLFRDFDGNIRCEITHVLPELMFTMREWVIPKEYAMLHALLLREPDRAGVAQALSLHYNKAGLEAQRVNDRVSRTALTISTQLPDSGSPDAAATTEMSWTIL